MAGFAPSVVSRLLVVVSRLLVVVSRLLVVVSRLLVAVVAGIGLAIGFAGAASAQYDPGAYCCAGTITSVNYVAGNSITITWSNPDQAVTPREVHAGYSLQGGKIAETDSGWWDGNIGEELGSGYPSTPPTSITFRNGADDTIGRLQFSKTFYVQIWFTCGFTTPDYTYHANNSSPYCSTPNSRPDHASEFYSIAKQVTLKTSGSGGQTGGTGGASESSAAKKAVVFDLTTTVTHANGTTSKVTATTLVDGDVVKSFGDPIKISFKNGKIALDRNSKLAYAPTLCCSAWKLQAGEVWQQGVAQIGGKYGSVESGVRGSYTLAVTSGADVVSVYTKAEAVTEGKKVVTVRAGQQVSIRAGGVITAPRRFTPPARQYWK
jgi:hypothetical protein